MFERPKFGNNAVLVHLDFPGLSAQTDIDEFVDLAVSAGAIVKTTIFAKRRVPDAKYFIGKGKAQEVQLAVVIHQADLVVFDHTLSPAQERNLEAVLKCRVLDRTGLILDIFAQRARTFEGKLQVELAQLHHLSTRLVRGWTHLERQKGGIGLRGPGETQLETDRRLIRVRIKNIIKRLEKVRAQREQGRRARRKAAIPTVACVGYTNAGKSTLFNQMTGANVVAVNKLFATLDPTLRRLELAASGEVILADTVGFVSKLPHDLVSAFRATLEETVEADLLLHVVDAHDDDCQIKIKQVNEVLADIGAEHVPQLQVFNKIDLLDNTKPYLERDELGLPKRVWVSAGAGAGIELLFTALVELLQKDLISCEICLPVVETRLRAALYQAGGVVDEHIDKEGRYTLSIRLPKSVFDKLLK